MTWYCYGTLNPAIVSPHNLPSSGPGTRARHRFRAKISCVISARLPGRKRFSATPDWMHEREKSFNPLQNGSKPLHKCAKP
jgi:hypothetical protein